MSSTEVSMEIYNQQIAAENPKVDIPEALTKEKTIEIVKEGNVSAFTCASNEDYVRSIADNPLILSILISSLTADWVMKEHGFN